MKCEALIEGVNEFNMGWKHRDTKAQRHKEDAQLMVSYARLLCASVPLCLCVSSYVAISNSL
jgi:hypothetical protein